MTNLRRLVLAAVVGGFAAGCSSDATTGTTLPNVVGSWNVTKFEFVSVANSSTRVDQIAPGVTAALVMTATTVAVAATGSGTPVNVFTGTYTETATTFVMSGTDSFGNPEAYHFALALSGTTLSLTGATTMHDFGSGNVAAYVNITATKE